jgi:hypothetical protein
LRPGFGKAVVVIAIVTSMTTVGEAMHFSRSSRSSQENQASVLQRFLSHGQPDLLTYRALRHLEAHNVHFGASATMDAWTEFDDTHGLRFQIVAESGNSYIRNHVLRAALESEQKMWSEREPQRASLTLDNYTFHDGGQADAGLAALGIKPRRKDVLLIDGSIYIHSEDGELARIEGHLSKSPSMWTRRVEIVTRYERLAGVRVPVSIESVAHILIAGRSTFKMTYEYESINGEHIGTPQPHSPQTTILTIN